MALTVNGDLIVQGPRPWVDVRWHGAKGDIQRITDASMSSGSLTLTSASNPFQAQDVNKLITVEGAGSGGGPLNTTIAAFVNAGTVTLAAASSGTVSGKTALWATDDTVAFQNALNAVVTYSGGIGTSAVVLVPKGVYVVGAL